MYALFNFVDVFVLKNIPLRYSPIVEYYCVSFTLHSVIAGVVVYRILVVTFT